MKKKSETDLDRERTHGSLESDFWSSSICTSPHPRETQKAKGVRCSRENEKIIHISQLPDVVLLKMDPWAWPTVRSPPPIISFQSRGPHYTSMPNQWPLVPIPVATVY